MPARKSRRYGSKRKTKRFTTAEKFAYRVGCTARGVSNKNSRVYASYQNGLSGRSTGQKKPLF